MTLDVEARTRLGAFSLDAGFATEGGVTAIFGRSGSGKTTLINIIAGLVRPEHGRVVLDKEVLLDTARGIDMPAYRRRIGYVFQEGRLFPHLNVRQNLLYGRWFAADDIGQESFDAVVEMLALGALLKRGTAKLSGGEKQRVAIGRALLASPRLLLMDEPLSSLDHQRKLEVVPYLERLRDQADVPIIYVSHSVPEVARLATTVVLIEDGKIVASGPTSQMMKRMTVIENQI
jgi:molybdate transport system ATP-binding protein